VSRFSIVPLTPTIGAEIRGVDLRSALDAGTIKDIRAALLEHLVLAFRDQSISDDEHYRFAGYFGEIDTPPFISAVHEGHPELTVLDFTAPRGLGADVWHADFTHRPEPPMGSILRAMTLPSSGGGDTCFVNMYAVYEGISAPLRGFLDGLSAVNTLAITAERAVKKGRARPIADGTADGYPFSVHPVVRVHPETGRKALYVNANWTSAIDGLSEAESSLLLNYLFTLSSSPEYQCRIRWEPGTVVFWDNRSVQHYAVADYSSRRVMYRYTIKGDRPYGPTPIT
jgi:taurine dioxygenase